MINDHYDIFWVITIVLKDHVINNRACAIRNEYSPSETAYF